MSACSAARKKALHSAKEPGRNDVLRIAVAQEREELRKGHAITPEHLPHFEQFVSDFEEALGDVQGVNMDPAIQTSLIEAARNLA